MSSSPDRDTGRHVAGVLVVGGGYAGVHAARAAAAAGAEVTVVDATCRYDFLPRLATVAGGGAPVDDASAPLDEFIDGVAELVRGVVVRIGDGHVEFDDGHRLSADAVVLTVGAVAVDAPVPGLEHAHPLRTADDAVALRSMIAEADALVVIGGGATGVQLAGVAAHQHPELEVTVVERGSTLLASMGDDLGRSAGRILADRGVEVLTRTEVVEIDPGGATLRGVASSTETSADRRRGLVVWAAGVDARADRLGVATRDGRADVGADLRVAGCRRTYAAGDVARHVDPDGHELPASAQVAVRAGAAAGRNAARTAAGLEPLPVRLGHQGWVLDLGGGRGVARIDPLAALDAIAAEFPLPLPPLPSLPLPPLPSLPLGMPPLDRIVPALHGAIDAKHLLEVGGLTALLRHRPRTTEPSHPGPDRTATV